MHRNGVEREMKALSIKQPHAEFILLGFKNREHRSYDTHFRGKFLIHVSKTPDKDFMNEFGFDKDQFSYGYLRGIVELYDTLDCGNGRYAWLLKDVTLLSSPILYKGKLSFFRVPDAVLVD